jgi:hypothetical protein
MSLEELLRDPAKLTALEPEEVAVHLLERFRNTSVEVAPLLLNRLSRSQPRIFWAYSNNVGSRRDIQ